MRDLAIGSDNPICVVEEELVDDLFVGDSQLGARNILLYLPAKLSQSPGLFKFYFKLYLLGTRALLAILRTLLARIVAR